MKISTRSLLIGSLLVAVPLAFAATRLGRRASAAQRIPNSQSVAKTALVKESSKTLAAANAFLATLTSEQRKAVVFDLTPETAAVWSNFPTFFIPRNGLRFGDLNAAQTAALMKLSRLSIGPSGFARMAEIRAADDVYAKINGQGGGRGGPNGGGPPSGGRPNSGSPGGDGQNGGGPGGPGGKGAGKSYGKGFGSANYFVAFLGTPSAKTAWILQIGGHHLAFNIASVGSTTYATPYFIGVEPLRWTENGVTHEPMRPMREAVVGLMSSLTEPQRSKAHLESRFSDVLVGPQRDGQFPTDRQGVSVASLSDAARVRVKEVIAAWTNDVAQAKAYQRLYFSELDKTVVAYSGSPTMNEHGDYLRIDGPHVWIEFSCQSGTGDPPVHYHTIWRDRVTDYGKTVRF